MLDEGAQPGTGTGTSAEADGQESIGKAAFFAVLTMVIQQWVNDCNMVVLYDDEKLARKRVTIKAVREMQDARLLFEQARLCPTHYMVIDRCATLLRRTPAEIIAGIASQLYPLDEETGLPLWPADMPETTLGVEPHAANTLATAHERPKSRGTNRAAYFAREFHQLEAEADAGQVGAPT